MKPIHHFAAGVLAFYLITAVLAGFAMRTALPGLNALGMAYIGLTYPVGLFCTASRVCSAVPPVSISKHFFTTKEQDIAG